MACNWLIGGPPSPEPTTNQTPAQSLGADSYLLRTPFPARRLIVTAVHVGPPSPTHHHHTAILFVPLLGRKSLQTPLSSPRSKQEGGKSAVAQFSFARQKLDCLALRWITSPLSGETMVLEIAPRKIKKEREREKKIKDLSVERRQLDFQALCSVKGAHPTIPPLCCTTEPRPLQQDGM